jgi:hypothetical protein
LIPEGETFSHTIFSKHRKKIAKTTTKTKTKQVEQYIALSQ